jgi:hypothetical protein
LAAGGLALAANHEQPAPGDLGRLGRGTRELAVRVAIAREVDEFLDLGCMLGREALGLLERRLLEPRGPCHGFLPVLSALPAPGAASW